MSQYAASSSYNNNNSSSSSSNPYRLKIKYGHDYKHLSKEEAVEAKSARILKRRWFRLFVDIIQGDKSLIKKIDFILHESFSPNCFTKEGAPYQTIQTCYGFFTAEIQIHFYRKKKPFILLHQLEDYDSYQIKTIYGGAKPTLEDVLVPNNFTFGIELELILKGGKDKEAIADMLEDYGIPCRSMNYTKEVTKFWKVINDSSITPGASDGNCTTFELISPILKGRAGLDSLQLVLGILSNQFDLSVNKSAGVHVHIGSDVFSQTQLNRLCANFIKYERAFDSIMPVSRRGTRNFYCRSNRMLFGLKDNDEINRIILSRYKKQGLQAVLNPGFNRYLKMNLQRLRHEDGSATIEFRGHSGSYNYDKIQAWILLLLYFCKNSIIRDPDNFKNRSNRSASFYRQRLFLWVIKNPILEQFYEKRAQHLENKSDETVHWICECYKSFSTPWQLAQHQKDTGHSEYPECKTFLK